ncbi:MAG: serine hydrolase domain-containing protein, partial [Steroidobacteraceae bacterium]
MRVVARLVAILALAGSTAALGAPSGRFERVRSFIRQQMTEKSLPSVAVAVAKDRKIVWEEGFGWADREQRIAADEHTMYSLASISKPITATGLMVLAERGDIDLDKPANDYLGAAKLRARIGDASAATLRLIANHSSGLPLQYQFFYEDEPWRRPSMDDTILRYGFLATPPGEISNYSNLGYGVLDYVIERVAKMSYADFMRREVFQPLGLTHMSVDIGSGLEPYAARRYASDGTPLPFYSFDHPGASAIFSSAHDLARFALFHLKAHLPDQKAILKDESIDAMHRHTIGDGIEDGYGIGFGDRHKDGYRVVSHSGGMGGVSTRMLLFPEEDLAVIVLSNSADRAAGDIASHIIAEYLPRWQTTPVEPAAPAAFVASADLVGVWQGTLSTYIKEMPFELAIRPGGEMIATAGDQIPSLVNKPGLEEGWLTGELRATIGTPDT